jgi:glucosyl-3-phosphoglycerate synthase
VDLPDTFAPTPFEQTSAWFETNTFRAGQFDARTLARIKGQTRISVLIPAKNEQATVGHIVNTVRAELIDEIALVNEIIVIDSHSDDQTASVASAAGATVFHVDDILPSVGSRPGKGEAMWKALAVMSGDIGLYLDADVSQFSADFVVGLLGPLLHDPELVFTKAFYDRPWVATAAEDGGPSRSTGGGRVTELVARPLIGAYAPLLAGFVQPLAGECAFRADALRAIPFVSDYGVDIGLMIDVLARHGLQAMAQVDLGVRLHRHQNLAALSAMTDHVQSAFDLRVGDAAGAATRQGTVFVRDGERMRMTQRTTHTSLRPPMAEILRQAHAIT